ncbi:MAG: hypothetical protein DRN42_02905 [Thermoplasmata archaeon]|nr:MAG: hypothetical protein DRN40_05245 [Thermoplasmata archaeon]RLF75413.1 MAG: hypothetical protein DRN42_02905 [Thermoplasmata archaeon]
MGHPEARKLKTVISFLIIIGAFAIWWGTLYYLKKREKLGKWGELYLFFLLLKTGRGRRLLDRLASRRRFWKGFGYLSIILSFFSMALMFMLLLLSAYFSLTARVKPTKPSMMLVLPGINPIIPFWYGIVALAIAIIIHEFSHGIQARVDRIKIKSLGLVLAIIPVGAFVEPDEEEVKVMPRRARMRMYASGPGMNIVVAMVLGIIFCWGLLGSVQADRGVIVYAVSEDSPLKLLYPDVDPVAILSVNGSPVDPEEDFYQFSPAPPGATIEMEVLNEKGEKVVLRGVPVGVVVTGLQKGYPAEKAGIEEGMIILSIDGKIISSEEAFTDFMVSTHPGQRINVTVLKPERGEGEVRYVLSNFTGIELAHKYDVYPLEEFKGVGFLGVSTAYLGVVVEGAESFIERLSHPVKSSRDLSELRVNLLTVMFTLPINIKIMPFHSPLTDIYHVNGVLGRLPPGAFWMLTNAVYYIFWINLLLGTFNTLPLLIMDGGVLFKDTVEGLAERLIKGEKAQERRKRFSQGIYTSVSYITVFLLLAIIFGPYLVR